MGPLTLRSPAQIQHLLTMCAHTPTMPPLRDEKVSLGSAVPRQPLLGVAGVSAPHCTHCSGSSTGHQHTEVSVAYVGTKHPRRACQKTGQRVGSGTWRDAAVRSPGSCTDWAHAGSFLRQLWM